eukprot:TRINITY_DN36976_c0_g1_i1.p1 TRINITY_DN36976_c0_g1~~TRINITY_DN36976_c0_g1_i1.p1  ORF type:complete len:277 (+),score=24.23 TRINITY_DN36976_c0_g1_i1:102-932(+)
MAESSIAATKSDDVAASADATLKDCVEGFLHYLMMAYFFYKLLKSKRMLQGCYHSIANYFDDLFSNKTADPFEKRVAIALEKDIDTTRLEYARTSIRVLLWFLNVIAGMVVLDYMRGNRSFSTDTLAATGITLSLLKHFQWGTIELTPHRADCLCTGALCVAFWRHQILENYYEWFGWGILSWVLSGGVALSLMEPRKVAIYWLVLYLPRFWWLAIAWPEPTATQDPVEAHNFVWRWLYIELGMICFGYACMCWSDCERRDVVRLETQALDQKRRR